MLKSSFSVSILTFALLPCFVLSAFYQYFQLVQQWPPNVCYQRRNTCYNSTQSQIFTIHGLWPSNWTINKNPSCWGNAFARRMLNNLTLVADLRRSWPDVVDGVDDTFWTKEWNKHGTCSEQTYKQTEYFQRAHEMWESYNITDIFSGAGIISTPGPTVPRPCNLTDIETRIQSVTQKIPVLRCKWIRLPMQQQGPSNVPKVGRLIFEVGLCYNYTGRVMIDCNPKQGGCKGNNIWF